jgi:hypothetical protein
MVSSIASYTEERIQSNLPQSFEASGPISYCAIFFPSDAKKESKRPMNDTVLYNLSPQMAFVQSG